MKHRFMIHALNHTWLVVDITSIGFPTEVYPEEGKEQMLSSRRFQSWNHAEHFLTGQGADASDVGQTQDALKRWGCSVLTIPTRY